MYLVYTQEEDKQFFEAIIGNRYPAEKFAKARVDDATRNCVYVVDLVKGFEVGHAWFGGDGEAYFHRNSPGKGINITQELKDTIHSVWLMVP